MYSPTLMHEYFDKSAERFPDKVALICGSDRFTYAQVEHRARLLALSLQQMGIRRHDRVVIFLDNSPESVFSLYGILKAGAVFVMLNGTVKSKKLGYILKDSGASLIISDVSKAQVVAEALKESRTAPQALWVGDPSCIPADLGPVSWAWDPAKGQVRSERGVLPSDPAASLKVRMIDQDLATLIYTSGSTGEPKGVMSTHFNMVSAARSIIQYIGNTSDDIVITVLPLSFDYGLYQVLMAFIYGGTVVLEKSFLFPMAILQTIQRERVTGFPIVPTIAAFLLRIQDLQKYDLSSLRYMTNTGAALPVEHIRRLNQILPDVRLFSMFGLTECKRVCYLPPEELSRRPASVGKAMPCCEVFLVDEQGQEVGPNEIGEMVVRGSNVMRGYWNAPELTERTYRFWRYPGEKVLFTGDYFRTDEEGFLYFLGRRDDLIKTKGERVGPKEVENALSEIPGVAEVAVIGVPDEVLGQAIKAFLVLSAGSPLDERGILKHCNENMEVFMVPKHIRFLPEMPKTQNGKVDKKALKDLP